MFIDHQSLGPRPAVMGGAILLGVGYFPLHRAYASGTGSVPWFCFCSFLTGFGSCMAFLAAVKTSAVNWPHHRGTATAFPLAAFGLSAFFFSFLGALLFPGDPSSFLELLSWGAFSLTFLGFFFLKTYAPSASYQAVPDSDADGSRSQRLRRTSCSADEPGTLPVANTSTAQQGQSAIITNDDSVPDETSSLMSSSSSTHRQTQANSVVDDDRSHRVDIRGLKLLGSLDFWQLFSIMTILAGVGLMTIKYVSPSFISTSPLTSPSNIGNDANALWKHFNPKVGESFLVHRQQMHVSILSVCSFIGRLLSGTFPPRALPTSQLTIQESAPTSSSNASMPAAYGASSSPASSSSSPKHAASTSPTPTSSSSSPASPASPTASSSASSPPSSPKLSASAASARTGAS